MNYLAHAYLSGNDEMVMLGNFIADEIKGNSYLKYPNRIKNGIVLHREIDTFTDRHPIVRQSTKRLHHKYSHFSGVIIDMFYDHFLAKNWRAYSEINLEVYVADFYKLIKHHFSILPPRIKYITPFMIKNNWLVNYVTLNGISKALAGINRRTKNKSKMNTAVEDLVQYYTEFENEFTLFFEELMVFTSDKVISLLNLNK